MSQKAAIIMFKILFLIGINMGIPVRTWRYEGAFDTYEIYT